MTKTNRRTFIKAAGTSAAATLISGMPSGWVGGAYAQDGPEVRTMRFGIIALTDCAPIVMAHELGYFKKFGIDSIVSKEASWAVIRDKLSLGENHATHMLIGMPLASTMGLAGSPVKPMVIPWLLNRNGQAITPNAKLKAAGVKQPAQVKPLADKAKAAGDPLTFAMTFPPGTHAMWMRYWLAAGGINPDKDVNLITIPPPQMVANMKVDKMDGFCVGEPWNNRAIEDGTGFTAVTTQQLWKDHPEKVCAFTEEFAQKNPRTVKAILKALHLASVDLDKLENRPKFAEIIGRPAYINCPPATILERLSQGRVSDDVPAVHVLRQQDRDLVEEQQKVLDPATLAGEPVRLWVVVGDLGRNRRRFHGPMIGRRGQRAPAVGGRAEPASRRSGFRPISTRSGRGAGCSKKATGPFRTGPTPRPSARR